MANGDVLSGAAWPACFGTTPTNILVKKVTSASKEEGVQSFDKDGKYYGGKRKRTRVDVTVEVEVLEGGTSEIAALKETGAGTAASARITDVDFGDDSETQPTATIKGWYYVNGTQGSYKFS